MDNRNLLVWILFCSNCALIPGAKHVDKARFFDELLQASDYEKRTDPGNGESTTVTISIFVNGISSMNEISMDYDIDVFLRQSWIDHRLKFHPNSKVNSTITLHEEEFKKLWVPDLFFTNMKDGDAHDITSPNRMIRLSTDGKILYSSRYTLNLQCSFALYRYPHDNQTCFIKMESYGYTTDELQFRWDKDPVQLPTDVHLPEYSLTDVITGDCTSAYATGSFTCIYAELHLQRLFPFYLIQIFVPSILIVVLSWMSFWIDYAAVPARISIGLLTVLTITTQASGVSSKLPKVSYIKAIDVWMFTNMIFVFAAMLEYAAVNMLARKDKIYKEQNKTLNGIIDDSIQLTGMRKMSIASASYSVKDSMADFDVKSKKSSICMDRMSDRALLVDTISRAVFPLGFVIFNAFYWPFYML